MKYRDYEWRDWDSQDTNLIKWLEHLEDAIKELYEKIEFLDNFKKFCEGNNEEI